MISWYHPLAQRFRGGQWWRSPMAAPLHFEVVRGLLGTDPPDVTLESTLPSPPQESIWHQLIRHRSPDLTLF